MAFFLSEILIGEQLVDGSMYNRKATLKITNTFNKIHLFDLPAW